MGDIHESNHWSAVRRHLTGEDRAVGHNAINWTCNSRIAQLSLCVFVTCFRRIALSGGALHGLLLGDALHAFEVFLSDLVLIPRLSECDLRIIDVFLRYRSLFIQGLAAFIELLLLVQDFFRRSDIELRLLRLLGYRSFQDGLIIRLRLFVRGLRLCHRSGEIPVFQLRQ